jgi:2-(3-amino-3-carboxypropyl)histidine synthase
MAASATARSTPSDDARALTFPVVGPELFAAVRRLSRAKVVLQAPAGLTRDAHGLARKISDATDRRVVVLARACFGACDVPTPDEAPGAELAVVLGHAPIPNMPLPLPTIFVEMRDAGGDPDGLAEMLVSAGLPKRLGIVASVQHLDLVPRLVIALEQRGYLPKTSEGEPRLGHAAQALGCNYSAAEKLTDSVDALVFLGTGNFHSLGLAFAVPKPVWTLDPKQNILSPPTDRSALIAKRLMLVASVRDARRWGILVSSFVGQDRSATANALQRRAREKGLDAEILVFGRLDPRDLEGRTVDAYVNTACPRIALDDVDLYPKPVLTPPEFLMVLGERPLDQYAFDTYH